VAGRGSDYGFDFIFDGSTVFRPSTHNFNQKGLVLNCSVEVLPQYVATEQRGDTLCFLRTEPAPVSFFSNACSKADSALVSSSFKISFDSGFRCLHCGIRTNPAHGEAICAVAATAHSTARARTRAVASSCVCGNVVTSRDGGDAAGKGKIVGEHGEPVLHDRDRSGPPDRDWFSASKYGGA
jgi:hypothetical protein